MKAPLLALSLLLMCPAVQAADLTLTDGRSFHDAAIISQTPRRVVIQHSDGLSGIEKILLPADLSARYPIDEAAALAAERQTAEARLRAEQFHKAEAERSSRLRLEREQSALHNAQIAALEASQRLAEAEAAQIASRRSENTYEYVSSYPADFSPYYRHDFGPSYSSNCTPRWNEKSCDTRLVRDDCSPRNDRTANLHRLSPVQKLNDSRTAHHSHKQSGVARISQAQPVEEERTTMRVAAAGVQRR